MAAVFGDASGAGEGVPVAIQPPIGEHQGKLGFRCFRQAFGVESGKPGPTIVRWEAVVGVEPLAGVFLHLGTGKGGSRMAGIGQKPPQDFLHIALSLGFLDGSRVISGPLQRPFCGQGCVGDAGLIAQATAGEFDELGPYLGWRRQRKIAL